MATQQLRNVLIKYPALFSLAKRARSFYFRYPAHYLWKAESALIRRAPQHIPANDFAAPGERVQGFDASLLDGPAATIERFVLEMTDRCNLRCIYCHQNLPDFKSERDIAEGSFDSLVDYIRDNKIPMIDLTGAGDLLMAPGWQEKCDRLLELGVPLHTTINLGKVLTSAEIDTLSRFDHITVSVDTMDKEILQKVRKAVDVRTIVYNMMRIKAHALKHNRTQLKWIVSAVYSGEVAEQLPDLVAFAMAFGAYAFSIQDLVEYGYIESNVTNVWKLKNEQAVRAADATRQALELARGAGLATHISPDLEERLVELKAKAFDHNKPQEAVKLQAGAGKPLFERNTYVERPPAGMTRDCTDPWSFMQVLGDGRVRPCCFSGVEMGTLGKDGTLADVRNSADSRRLREELLTGKLDDYCAACNFRPTVSVQEFQQKMRRFVSKKVSEAAKATESA